MHSSFLKLSNLEWKILHDPTQFQIKVISVTNLLQFIGFGYSSRNQMFKEKTEESNKYLQLALAHGTKYESQCLSSIQNLFTVIDNQSKCSVIKDGVLGTVDAWVIDNKCNNELGIIEVKCPYGVNYSNFSEDEIPSGICQKRWKHWLQLQIYLFMNKEIGVSFGLLCYFYKNAGFNGEHKIQIFRVKPEEDIWNFLELKKQSLLYFNGYAGRSYTEIPKYRVKKAPLTQSIIDKSIIQVLQI